MECFSRVRQQRRLEAVIAIVPVALSVTHICSVMSCCVVQTCNIDKLAMVYEDGTQAEGHMWGKRPYEREVNSGIYLIVQKSLHIDADTFQIDDQCCWPSVGLYGIPL